MRWKSGRRSENVEDRRGSGLGHFPGRSSQSHGVRRRVGLGGGLGTIVLIVVLIALGVDPTVLISQLGQTPANQGAQSYEASPGQFQTPARQDELADFVSVVLADTEDTWEAVFDEHGRRYVDPRLVLFTGMTRSACGLGQAAMGPFYCPGDQKVYIDLAFYDELREQFGAPGDFAQAYVIAHEVGHHVQKLLGISDQVQSLRDQASRVEANQLSVRLELQADCFAGIWANRAHRARQILERGDIEEGLNAASAIGDDRLQRQSRGTVAPDSFTHGSSAQRVRWFERGLESGTLSACDTFSTDRL